MQKFLSILLGLCIYFTQAQAQKFEWAKPFTGNSAGKKIIQDNSGYLYITGFFSGTVDFDPSPNTLNLTCGSTIRNTFIAKMDTSGNLIWARQIVGSGNEPNDIVLDNQGNVILTGYFTGTVDMDPGLSTLNITSAGLKDLHFLKLDNQGNYITHFQLGGTHTDYGASLETDLNGNIFIAGVYSYTVDVDPSANVLNLVSTDSNNMFLLKLSSSLTLTTVKKIESNHTSARVAPTQLKIDPIGNIYVTGEFYGKIDFDPSLDSAYLNINYYYNTTAVAAFLCKYDNNLEYTWSGQFGADCKIPSIDLSPSNEIYLHLSFKGGMDVDPGLNIVNAGNGFTNLFRNLIIKLSSNGTYIWHKVFDQWTTRLVGSKSIYVDSNKSITICGQLSHYPYSNFYSPPDFIEDPSIQTVSLGTGFFNSGFLVQLDTAGTTKAVRTIQNNGNSSILSIAVGNSGSIYSTGLCQTTCDFNPGPGVFNLSGKGFVQKLSKCNNSPTYSSLSLTACDSVIVHGYKYTQSGTYTHILPNASGCDSIVTVNLTIPHSYDTILNLPQICNSITINGIVYNMPGNYVQSYTTVNGCDSTYHINVGIFDTTQCPFPLVSQLSLNYWNHNNANAVWTYSAVDTFNVRYKATSSNTWNYLYNIKGKNAVLTGLQPSTQYEYQIMPVCPCNPGYSASKVWTTTANCISTSDLYNNNSMATAQSMPLNCEVTGTISSSTDEDYYYLPIITTNNKYYISLTELSGNFDMELLASYGTIFYSSSSFGNNSEYMATQNYPPLTTYIKIKGVNNASSNNCYVLKISDIDPSTCPSAPSINNLTMPYWGDTYAKFQWNAMPNAQQYNVRYRAVGALNWTSTYVYATTLSISGLQPNTTYEWAIAPHCHSTGTVSAYSASKIFTTTPTCQSTFDGASNNSIAGLYYIPFNTDIKGRIDVATDVDYYKLAVPSSSPIMISATSLPANYQLSFYNSAMIHLYTSNSPSSNSEYITINPPGAGNYYIRIQGVNGASSPLCYNLKVINTNIPCNTPTSSNQLTTDVGNSYASLTWKAVPGALTYDVQYRLQGAPSWTTVSNIASNVYMLTGLAPSSTYEWAIRANCVTNSSAYTSSSVFTTTSMCQGVYDDNLNNTMAGAKYIPSDMPIFGTIDNMNDEDYFKLNLYSGTPVHLNLYTQPANFKLNVYDASSNLLRTSNSFGVNAENITFTPSTTGLYYIKVSSVQNSYSTNQCYTLKVNTSSITCIPPVVSGLSLTRWDNSSAICIWNSVSGAFSYNLRYRVIGAPSWITLSNLTGNTVNLTGLTPSTTYECQLSANCSSGISAYCTSKQFTTTANCKSTDDNNNNNVFYGSTIIPMNTNIGGMISNSTDVDYYQFIVDVPSSLLHISLKNLPADYNLILYNAFLQQQASSTASGTADELMMITLPQGTYYAVVVPVNGSFNTSSCYTLKISNTGSYKQEESNHEQPIVKAEEEEFLVYPNPTQGIVKIEYSLKEDNEFSLALLDLSGRVIYSKDKETKQKGEHQETLNLTEFDLAEGLYFLRVKIAQQEYIRKIQYLK